MIVAQNSDETFIEQYKELLLNYAQDDNPVDNITQNVKVYNSTTQTKLKR
jgi:hypothetical protein